MKIRINRKSLENMKGVYESIKNLLSTYSNEFELTDENFKKVKRATTAVSDFRNNFYVNTLIEIVGPDNEIINIM